MGIAKKRWVKQVGIVLALLAQPFWKDSRFVTVCAACEEAARRRPHRRAQKKGETVKAATLSFADWLLIGTTLPPERLSAEAILVLYRVRWQVELVLK